VSPSREELIESFHAMLAAFTDLRVENDWTKLSAEYANRMIPSIGIRPGAEMLVRSARSFLSENGIGILDSGPEIIGNFQAFCIESWYDVPFTEAAAESFDMYRVDVGLHLMIGQAVLNWPATGDRELIGDVLVPLDHGKPSLFSVIR
ncbi:hypothetical protein KDA00_03630, partial [Candidatus Saccharibacteria bacterium]|nr:hypothetical protein [Candidatus Saccharibacteria bacterium]